MSSAGSRTVIVPSPLPTDRANTGSTSGRGQRVVLSQTKPSIS